MHKIRISLVILLVIGLCLPANAASMVQQSSDFFTEYNIPFYGQWEFSELRNTSIQEGSGDLSYVAALNGSYSNHIVYDIVFLSDCTIRGTIELTNGQNISFSARSYKEWLIQNKIEFTLMGETDIDGFTNIGLGYGDPVLHSDICTNLADRSSGLAMIFGDPQLWNSYLGIDLLPNNVHALIFPITTGAYVRAVYIDHQSGGAYRLKVSEYGPNELSDAVSRSLADPQGTSYPGIEDLLNNLGAIVNVITALFSMVMYIVVFILWLIYPTHFILLILTAESIIVLLSLTTSRDIFGAMAKFGSYNEKMFYALIGIANVTISFFGSCATFVYNILHALWPLG